MASAHDFTFTTIDNKPLDMKDFAGKPVLVVNVASYLRVHAAIRRPGEAARDLRAEGAGGAGRAVQRFRRAGAQDRARDRQVLRDHVRRQIPADRQAEGRRRGCARALPMDLRRGGRGRGAQVELPQVPDRQGRQPEGRLAEPRAPRLQRDHQRHRSGALQASTSERASRSLIYERASGGRAQRSASRTVANTAWNISVVSRPVFVL